MNPNRKRDGRQAGTHTVISSPSRRRRMRAPGVRALLSIAGALAAGVAMAVLAAGGSYAYLNVTVPTGAGGTVSAGTSSLTLKRGTDPATSTLTIPASVYASMLPGDVVSQTLTLANVGDVAQSVSAVATDDGAWETRISPAACAGTLTSAPVSTTAVAFTTLAVGASRSICVQVTLPATAPASAMGTTVGYTLTLTGTQVAS